MMKRKYLIIVIAIFVLITIIAYNLMRSAAFNNPTIDSWMQLSMFAIFVHTVYAVFVPQQYRYFKLIPGIFIIGFMITYVTNYSLLPIYDDPFGILSMIYGAILVTGLMYVIDLMSPKYTGFHIFVSVILFAVLVYANINTIYLSYNMQPIDDMLMFWGQVILTHFVFYGPYWLMVLIFVLRFNQEPMLKKQKETIPYNRYRPNEVDPALQKRNVSTTQRMTTPTKTKEQLDRERNAIKSLTILKDAGLLSDEEFERKKKKVLSSQ
ncbi:MAG: SHOCT domain-containing protein [Acholeplasmataceae bacterium]|nr:SHOCT domain-containing protein [Acholeplasmataceae bacterium]